MNADARLAAARSLGGRRWLLGRLAALAGAACLALGVHAQTNPIRDLPKNAKTGYLTHVSENAFTLDGQRVVLAPGGIIRGSNNLILMPTAVSRETLVLYTKDPAGNLLRAWVLTKDEAAKANVSTRFTWQTSPESGTPIGQVLPSDAPTVQRGAAPGFMRQTGPTQSDTTQPGTTQSP